MSRRQAREFALQALYQLDLNPVEGQDADAAEQQALDAAFMESDAALDEKTRSFATSLVHGTRRYLAALDEVIEKHAKHWKVRRMAVVDRNIARMAAYEMMYAEPALDPGVAIDEAVELAKAYGSDASSAFLNGILDAIRKDVRQD